MSGYELEQFTKKIEKYVWEFKEQGMHLFTEHRPYQIKPWDSKTDFEGMNEINYFHIKVANDIKARMRFAFHYLYTFDGVKVDFKVVDYKENLQRWEYLLFMLNLLIFILNKLNKRQGRSLKITFFCCKLVKKFPKLAGEQLTSEHVNTGVTISSGDGTGEIIVYREEEMTKVLIHELVHFYDFDQKHVSRSAEATLNQYFNLGGKSITVNESFTDIFAVLLNTILYSIFEGKKLFSKNLAREKQFVINQAARVLRYQGYKVLDSGVLVLDGAVNVEHTHVISYYVLKALCFNRLEDFMKFFSKNGYSLLDATGYIRFLQTHLSDLMVNVIEYDVDLTHVLNSSLRMTSLDIYKLLQK